MVRSLTFVPAILCVAAIATAQTPTPAAQERPANPPAVQQPATPPSKSSMTAGKVTYTGCLKPGTAPGTWILDSAEMAREMGAASASAATPGAGAVGTSGVTKSTFTLNTKPDAQDLKPHVNHKIQVTGTVGAAKTSASPSGAAASSAAANKDFAVESFKMVSATCP